MTEHKAMAAVDLDSLPSDRAYLDRLHAVYARDAGRSAAWQAAQERSDFDETQRLNGRGYAVAEEVRRLKQDRRLARSIRRAIKAGDRAWAEALAVGLGPFPGQDRPQ